jgi:hypothetical protein
MGFAAGSLQAAQDITQQKQTLSCFLVQIVFFVYSKVGENQMYGVCMVFLAGFHQIYGYIWRKYTVLANPTFPFSFFFRSTVLNSGLRVRSVAAEIGER